MYLSLIHICSIGEWLLCCRGDRSCNSIDVAGWVGRKNSRLLAWCSCIMSRVWWITSGSHSNGMCADRFSANTEDPSVPVIGERCLGSLCCSSVYRVPCSSRIVYIGTMKHSVNMSFWHLSQPQKSGVAEHVLSHAVHTTWFKETRLLSLTWQ